MKTTAEIERDIRVKISEINSMPSGTHLVTTDGLYRRIGIGLWGWVKNPTITIRTESLANMMVFYPDEWRFM